MVELVDTRDLKSLGHRLCRFKPGSGYQKEGRPSRRMSAAAFFLCSRLPRQHLRLSGMEGTPRPEAFRPLCRQPAGTDRRGLGGTQYEMGSKMPATRQVPPCRRSVPERLSCISSTASSRRASVRQPAAKSSVSESARR